MVCHSLVALVGVRDEKVRDRGRLSADVVMELRYHGRVKRNIPVLECCLLAVLGRTSS